METKQERNMITINFIRMILQKQKGTEEFNAALLLPTPVNRKMIQRKIKVFITSLFPFQPVA